MSARQKLNQACINGALLISGVIGLVTGSFAVFLGGLVFLVLLNLHAGEIRLRGRQRRR